MTNIIPLPPRSRNAADAGATEAPPSYSVAPADWSSGEIAEHIRRVTLDDIARRHDGERITQIHPSQEVRRQERTPLPSAWWAAVFVFALALAAIWSVALGNCAAASRPPDEAAPTQGGDGSSSPCFFQTNDELSAARCAFLTARQVRA